MEAEDRTELDLQLRRMRDTLKHARACLRADVLDEVRTCLESVADETQMALNDLRSFGVLSARDRGTRRPPA